MGEDRIKSEVVVSYKAWNSRGKITLEIKPVVLIVDDQSPESASAHLLSIIGGIVAPAQAQVGKNE